MLSLQAPLRAGGLNICAQHESLLAWTDGGARGNPGPAGIGGVIKSEGGELVAEVSEYLGEATNNVAEYTALIRTVERCRELGAKRLRLFLDSELVVKQVKGVYKVKNPGLKPLHAQAHRALAGLKFDISYVPREENKEADALANQAMDGALGLGADADDRVADEFLASEEGKGQDSLF